MKLFFTRCHLLVRTPLTVLLSGLLLGAQAQPTVTSTSPVRNANAAPRPGNVVLTYNQGISAATAATVRVFSQQAGGRKALSSAAASGNVVTLDPAQDFRPGEVISVTAPATVLGTGGAARPYVYQFTAQAGAGFGTFGGGSDPAVSNTPYSVAVADVDGDGDLDLLTAKSGSSTVSVRLNDGLGTYSGGSEVTVGDLARDVIAADVDGDGDLDLLTANYRNSVSNTVSVRLNNGLGTFGGGSEVTVGLGPTKLAVGDVDGDGDLDLLTANATNITTNGVSNGLVSVRLNNGSGTFSGGQEVSVGGANSFPADVTVGDVDGDGDLDILAGVFISGANSTVSVRLNDGAGTFTAPTTGAQVSVTNLFSVAAADVDGDGDLDLLTATGLTVSVRLNNGTGVFTPPATGAEVSVGNGLNNVAYDLTTADVDGDGDLDLLTANATGNGAPNSLVSVRLNNGSGTFAGGQDVGVGLDANSITVGDADGDGDVDLFVTNRTSNTVSVRLNQAAATSPTVAITTTSANPTSIAPFLVTVTFSQPVTGFTASGITVANGSVSSPLTVSGNSYSFNVTPVAAGAVTIGVAAGVAQSAGGFGNLAATPLVITYQIINTNSIWTGAISTDWFVGGNWTDGVPTAFHDAIIIPSSFGRQPVIGAGAALSKDLAINAGASLTMSGGTLDVRGDWANNSTFTATGGTVLFGAVVPANLPGPNVYGSSVSRFWNLAVLANGLRVSTTAGAAVQRVLTLTGNLATLGNPFTLLSSPTAGDALVVNSGGVVTGTATVQWAIDPSVNPGLGYRHYSAPVSNSTVADLATPGFTPVVNPDYNTAATPNTVMPFPTVFGYDQSRVTLVNNFSGIDRGFFSPATLSDPLLVGRGYDVNIGANQLVDFQGTLNNGDVPLTLSRNTGTGAADGGWQLLGNPYPAPLDYSLVLPADRSGLDAAIYVFSSTGQYTGRYRTYLNGMGNPVLPVGQGFFAHVSDGQTSAALTFRNSQRLTVPNGTPFQRLAETRALVQLTLANAAGTLADETYLYFQAGATAGVEAAFDAVKLPNPSGLNLASTAAGQELAVNGLSLLGTPSLTVPLTMRVPATGTYTLNAEQLLNFAGTDVSLRDLQLNTLIDLRLQPSYTFTLNALSTTPRFELVFGAARVLGTAPATLAAQVAVFPNPASKAVFIELPGSLRRQAVTAALVDALGRTVRTQTLAAGLATHTLPLAGLAAGVYALRLSTSAGVVVKKLVVE